MKNDKIPILILKSVNGAEVFGINSLSIGGLSVDIRIFRSGDIAPMLIERAVSYVQIADYDLLDTRTLADIPKMSRAIVGKAITERKYLQRFCRRYAFGVLTFTFGASVFYLALLERESVDP